MQRRVFLRLGAVGLAVWAGSGLAMSPARPVIRLSCPDTPQGAELCKVMVQKLSEAVPKAVIRRVAQGDEAVTRSGDIGVAVQITVADAQGIGARLDWQAGTGGARQTGRDISLDVMDTGLTPTILQHLADALLRDDKGLQTKLHAMGAK